MEVPKPRSSPQTGELGHVGGGSDSALEHAKFPAEFPGPRWQALLLRWDTDVSLCHATGVIPQAEASGRLSHLPKAAQVVNSKNGGDVMLPAAPPLHPCYKCTEQLQ